MKDIFHRILEQNFSKQTTEEEEKDIRQAATVPKPYFIHAARFNKANLVRTENKPSPSSRSYTSCGPFSLTPLVMERLVLARRKGSGDLG
jgi:hypothetical protein